MTYGIDMSYDPNISRSREGSPGCGRRLLLLGRPIISKRGRERMTAYYGVVQPSGLTTSTQPSPRHPRPPKFQCPFKYDYNELNCNGSKPEEFIYAYMLPSKKSTDDCPPRLAAASRKGHSSGAKQHRAMVGPLRGLPNAINLAMFIPVSI